MRINYMFMHTREKIMALNEEKLLLVGKVIGGTVIASGVGYIAWILFTKPPKK